ncbi:c-type cytochrome [Methylobacterium sp. ID0610]|uniref:c-type cytochrome n=1 Tax=Methylobacterium carpenticola TaxID=3344827 RepID=UPI003690950C
MRRALVLGVCLCALAGCKREERQLRLDPPVAEALDGFALMPNRIGGAPPDIYPVQGEPYAANAYNLGQGKRLYEGLNCKGCHADGGGVSGPAFLDGWWRYGPDIVSIVATLRDGRPNGMPAYRDRMTLEQIWQLAGYVQTVGAYSAKTAAPSRSDAMQSRPAENRAPAASGAPSPPSR